MNKTASQTDTVLVSPHRLPTHVKPVHYDLTIRTDLKQLTFEGVVKISLGIVGETSEIVLNASHLDLGKATVYSDAWKREKDAFIFSVDETKERVTYRFTEKLTAGSKAELKIHFSGNLTGNMVGYYRARWDHDEETEYYALTQLATTSARRAFPCWDEPLLKATYALSLISRADTVNLSNMPVISEVLAKDGTGSCTGLDDQLISTQDESWKITKFQKSPPMSTYIVAYANGPFTFMESAITMPLSDKEILLRIYTTPDLIPQARFALEIKASALPLYEQLFNLEYPLPKLDTLVASDFGPGAMENWGLITGRTSSFLIDPDRADIKAKKEVATTQSHEVAHMWFGNITTMEWWTYFYLNEGFATLMSEGFFCDKVFPEWRSGTEFINKHLNRALKQDAKLSSQPIEVEFSSPDAINQAFIYLIYSKASAVLLMLSSYVGEDKFFEGVSIYLKKKKYANSVTSDLWDSISTATGKNIPKLMDNWINKTGFPVVTVTEDANGITIRQDLFLDARSSPQNSNTMWSIPLTILSMGTDGKPDVDRTSILEEREKKIALDTSKPFKLNAGTRGVYRVLYSPERLLLIAAEATKSMSIFSLDDRMGLVHDAVALGKAGLCKLSNALTFVNNFRSEKEYLMWQAVAENLSDVQDIWWEYLGITKKFKEFRRSLFSPLAEKLGYNYPKGEALDTVLLRTLAVEQAYEAGDKRVIDELRGRFKVYAETQDDSQIPPDLQTVIYSAAVKYGGRKEYEIMVKIYHNPKTTTAQNAAIFAMGSTQDESLLEETFNFISNKAREQDYIFFFPALAKNYKARRMLTGYLQDEYDQLNKRLEGSRLFNFIVSASISFYSAYKDYNDIEAYFEDKDTSRYNQILAQALDTIRARADCVETSTQDLKQWLSKI